MKVNKVMNTKQDAAYVHMPVIRRLRWSKEEKLELKQWLESGWDWRFPGYKQAALHINAAFGNNRTPNACRMMGKRIAANDL